MAARHGADAASAAAAASARPQGVDPKAATLGTRSAGPVETAAPVLTMGQRSMLDVVERTQGKAARAQAEVRLAARQH